MDKYVNLENLSVYDEIQKKRFVNVYQQDYYSSNSVILNKLRSYNYNIGDILFISNKNGNLVKCMVMQYNFSNTTNINNVVLLTSKEMIEYGYDYDYPLDQNNYAIESEQYNYTLNKFYNIDTNLLADDISELTLPKLHDTVVTKNKINSLSLNDFSKLSQLAYNGNINNLIGENECLLILDKYQNSTDSHKLQNQFLCSDGTITTNTSNKSVYTGVLLILYLGNPIDLNNEITELDIDKLKSHEYNIGDEFYIFNNSVYDKYKLVGYNNGKLAESEESFNNNHAVLARMGPNTLCIQRISPCTISFSSNSLYTSDTTDPLLSMIRDTYSYIYNGFSLKLKSLLLQGYNSEGYLSNILTTQYVSLLPATFNDLYDIHNGYSGTLTKKIKLDGYIINTLSNKPYVKHNYSGGSLVVGTTRIGYSSILIPLIYVKLS